MEAQATRRFVTFFPRLRPIAAAKDVGQIPFYFAKHLGWNSALYYVQIEEGQVGNEEFHEHVDARCLAFGDSRSVRLVSFIDVLLNEAPEIDVLNLYQLGMESLILAEVYKRLNPEGVVFLKLDMDAPSARMLLEERRTPKRILFDGLLRRSSMDFFTVETTDMFEEIEPFFQEMQKPLHLMPNGFSHDDPSSDVCEKESRILTVARMGMPQKHTELLIDALVELGPSRLDGWHVDLVGTSTDGFRTFLVETIQSNPWLESVIEFHGVVRERKRVFQLFSRADIFVLTSRWESYGLVLLEAAYFECFIISTDVGAARDVTADGEVGHLIPVEDRDALVNALQHALSSDLDEVGSKVSGRVRSRFSWESICEELQNLIGAGPRTY